MRGWLALQLHHPVPAFTVSLSVFPALNVGNIDADIGTASPLLGFRPVRAGLLLVPNAPDETGYEDLSAAGYRDYGAVFSGGWS